MRRLQLQSPVCARGRIWLRWMAQQRCWQTVGQTSGADACFQGLQRHLPAGTLPAQQHCCLALRPALHTGVSALTPAPHVGRPCMEAGCKLLSRNRCSSGLGSHIPAAPLDLGLLTCLSLLNSGSRSTSLSALQIAVRVSQQEAGRLEEVHFFLFGQVGTSSQPGFGRCPFCRWGARGLPDSGAGACHGGPPSSCPCSYTPGTAPPLT